MKSLEPRTTVHEVITAYPFLVEALPAAYPGFAPLRQPAMRAVMARIATLERAAGLAGVPVGKLMEDIARLIRQHTGQEVTLQGADLPDGRVAKVAALKRIIENLHAGGTLEEARRAFEEVAGQASPEEIAEMEQELIRGGMPVESIQRLCDVHVQVFRGSLDAQEKLDVPSGHPVHTYLAENREIEKAANRWVAACRRLSGENPPAAGELAAALRELAQVEIHYTRKENQLFPSLERHGFTGPSKVMWGVHDGIRKQLKGLRQRIEAADLAPVATEGLELARQITEMIYKEEKILLPVSLSLIKEPEWVTIRAGDDAIGYAFVTPGDAWKPAVFDVPEAADQAGSGERISLATGSLSPEQLKHMLVALPVEISFVDDQDIVRFYSDHAQRLFPRSPGVIGRRVQDCHPQKSLHLVEAILKAFKAGTKNEARFWLQFKGRFVLVSYYPVRDEKGTYLGCLEVTQDVTNIRSLQGEKRLLDWD